MFATLAGQKTANARIRSACNEETTNRPHHLAVRQGSHSVEVLDQSMDSVGMCEFGPAKAEIGCSKSTISTDFDSVSINDSTMHRWVLYNYIDDTTWEAIRAMNSLIHGQENQVSDPPNSTSTDPRKTPGAGFSCASTPWTRRFARIWSRRTTKMEPFRRTLNDLFGVTGTTHKKLGSRPQNFSPLPE